MDFLDNLTKYNYIISKTGYEKRIYRSLPWNNKDFYGLTHKEEYFKNKISVMVALAPVTKISPIRVEVLRVLANS